jgi:Heliorhodopsin/Protein of unknown function (DUF1295)
VPGARTALAITAVTLWSVRLTANWARGWPGLHHEDWRYAMLRERSGLPAWVSDLGAVHLLPTVHVWLGSLGLYAALTLGRREVGALDVLAAVVVVRCTPGSETVPGFVYGIVIVQFVLFFSFGLNQWLQYRSIGRWSDYVYGEKAYLLGRGNWSTSKRSNAACEKGHCRPASHYHGRHDDSNETPATISLASPGSWRWGRPCGARLLGRDLWAPLTRRPCVRGCSGSKNAALTSDRGSSPSGGGSAKALRVSGRGWRSSLWGCDRSVE